MPAAAIVLKPIIDGITCALQATDKALVPVDAVNRLAQRLEQAPKMILNWLTDHRFAVLGLSDRLVTTARTGQLEWNPNDRCVVGIEMRLECTDREIPVRVRATIREVASG